MISPLRTALLALALAVGPASARQPAPAPLPAAAMLLRHVTANGTTKPPGAALDGRLGSSMALAAADMRLGRVLRAAICTGC